VLARDLTAAVKIPIVAVLGNHDYESNESEEIVRILTEAGVHILDGDAVEIHGVGFAGVKGFAGGFGRGTLGPWGEPAIKASAIPSGKTP
jgi:Icc-related predicted phosphoesterase